MDREITLRDYGRVLWSGRWLILATTVVALLLGLLLGLTKKTTFTARSTVYMGQATTASGQPVVTALTSPVSAAAILGADEFAKITAERLTLGSDDAAIAKVRDSVSFAIQRAAGNVGVNQPTIATVVAANRSRKLAKDIANTYAQVVFERADKLVGPQITLRKAQIKRLEARRSELEAEATRYRTQLASASTDRVGVLGIALDSIRSELYVVSNDIDQHNLDAEKAEQIERPAVLTSAVSAKSSGGAKNRLSRGIFAALIGAILGVIATLVWKGGPAGREPSVS